MKHIQEKVKDLINVHKLLSLQDFSDDPAETLAGYRFTDATSELMVKWLDRVAGLQNGDGYACALAGYRGVGKSHFSGAFAALVSIPDLRSKVTDSHVANGAQGLLRRRYPVINVRRGTRETLLDEVRDGVARTFDLESATLPDKVMDLLVLARTRSGDLPFLMLIDTAVERTSRVSRDDGPVLAEIADAARSINAFVGVILDDDISGADGTNSAIVKSYTIDYLDQEHLYKVVDTFVFPKENQFRPVLHDIYEYFREVMPSFRWSEQKFTALYPLHPVVLEVAPFVRLFVHDFALLGFASEAGERILGRPANSLIALDEVFDKAEKGLRKIDDLKEAFAAYDRLNSEVIAKIPVMQRLQAKLVLKALLLLSLDGQGTTASEITAGMLIYDEKDAQKASNTVEELIRTFAEALPDDVRVYSQEGSEVRYSLKVSSKDKLNTSLQDEAAKLDRKVVDAVLHKLFHERYSDSTFFSADGGRRNSVECYLTWRGGLRRGRVTWNLNGEGETVNAQNEGDAHDWEVIVDRIEDEESFGDRTDEYPRAQWRPAELKPDEIDALLRFHVLSTNADLREQFGDQIRASLHSHALHVRRIVNRVFIDDGRLLIDGFDYNFNEDARGTAQLSELFTYMLEPLFEARYPQHPFFLRRIGISEVASLVTDFYSGSRNQLSEVQELAQTFAMPLGIVKLVDGVYVSESVEKLRELSAAAAILTLVDNSEKECSVHGVYDELKRSPYGYVREAQQLVMAAMVSQRLIEFVTSKGDRINQRSLDLKIIWDDIVGIARPHETAISSKKLIQWAEWFTGDREFKSFDIAGHRKNLIEGISEWIENWDKARTLIRFSEIPVESVNSDIWRKASKATNTLGTTAATFKLVKDNSLGLEECFGRISELFLDDPAKFKLADEELKLVENFVRGWNEIRTIRGYLAIAELTDSEEIENCRESLLEMIEEFNSSPSESRVREVGYLWVKFKREFIDYFASAHDAIMRSHRLQAHADEILRSDDWWEFENLSIAFEWNRYEAGRVQHLREQVSELNCTANVRELLKSRPFCNCGFSLSHEEEWAAVTADLETSLSYGLATLKAAIIGRSSDVVPLLENLLSRTNDREMARSIGELISHMRAGTLEARLNGHHLGALRSVLRTLATRGRGDLADEIEGKLNASLAPAE